MERLKLDFRAVVYRENEFWLAHCLETDVVAEGHTPEAAYQALDELTEFQVSRALEENDLTSIWRPAPAEILNLYARAREMKSATRKKASQIDRFEARKLVFA